MRLPIPIFYNDEVIREVEIKKPKPKILTEAYSKVERQEVFQAYTHLLAGGISSAISTTGTDYSRFQDLQAICQKMPWRSAVYLGIQIIKQINKQEEIKLFYTCDTCGQIHKPDSPGNANIIIDEIPIIEMESEEKEFTVDLNSPATLTRGSEEMVIRSITFEIPTLTHCMAGHRKSPGSEREYYIRSECIQAVNGDPINPKWRNMWGYLLMSNIDFDDHVTISEALNQYGYEDFVTRRCTRCDEEIRVPYEFTGFFGSGLHNTPRLGA